MCQKIKAKATNECVSIVAGEEKDDWHTEIYKSVYALFPALLNIGVNENSDVLISV